MKRYKYKYGVTLVEILVVVAVIAILATMVIGIAARINDQSKEQGLESTFTLLESALRYNLNDETLLQKNEVFKMLTTDKEQLKSRAEMLQKALKKEGISSEVISNQGFCGGGALPMEEIDTYAVRLQPEYKTAKERSRFAEDVYSKLMLHTQPVIGILKKGNIDFDVLTVRDEEIPVVAKTITEVVNEIFRS